MTRAMRSRVFRVLRAGSLGGLLFASDLVHAQGLPDKAQPPLREAQLSSGLYLIKAEVADTDATREIGLMFRKKMADNHGMLFIFGRASEQCMWMKNTLLPLSVAFIDDQGVIVNIEDMKPQTENSHCSTKPVSYAIEMNLGWFASKHILPGARVAGLLEAGKAH